MLITGIVLSTVCDIMQRAVKGIEEWCTSHQLAVNPNKTEMVLFTRRYKIGQMTRITFYQQELTEYLHAMGIEQVKYLGVILDTKLN